MLNLEVKVMNGMWRVKNTITEKIRNFLAEEDGSGMIETVVIIVIVLALAVVFRKNIAELVNKMWDQIFKDANAATKTSGTSTQFNP